jgi:hypothetical protein
MFGIRSSISKQFVFGIKEKTKRQARNKLFKKIGYDALKYRFYAAPIPNPKNKMKRSKHIMPTTNSDTKVITGKVRAAYLHVFEPWSANEGQDKKYSVCLIIAKTDKTTLKKIKAAVDAAKKAGVNTLGGKIPATLKTPLRDGDEERPDQEEFAGAYFLNANSKTKPGLIDQHKDPILDSDDLYSGCYIRASINFYAYNTSGNKGIACGLNNIQKWEDGDFLGGRSKAEDDFGELESDDAGDDFLD